MTAQQEQMRQRQISHLKTLPQNIWYRASDHYDISGPGDLDEFFEEHPRQVHLYEELCQRLGVKPHPDMILDSQSGRLSPQNDLGLRNLSDDQLLNLMEQGWQEIGSRTENLWSFWMNTKERIEAEFKERCEAWFASAQAARQERLSSLRTEISNRIQGLAAEGKVRILTPEEESEAVGQLSADTYQKLVEQWAAAIQGGHTPSFSLLIEDGVITVQNGKDKIRATLPPVAAKGLLDFVERLVKR
jgi:hypothetical protein